MLLEQFPEHNHFQFQASWVKSHCGRVFLFLFWKKKKSEAEALFAVISLRRKTFNLIIRLIFHFNDIQMKLVPIVYKSD